MSAARLPRARARWAPGRTAIVALVVLAAFGFLVYRGLGDATVYFKTADEAVRDKVELGDRRFRVEGLVLEPVERIDDRVEFTIISAGERVRVHHQGDPPELFKPGIPVVLEGRWDGEVYASDAIMVKHTTEYREKHPDRVADYTDEGPS